MRIKEIRSTLCTTLLILAAIPSHATNPALEATYSTSISTGGCVWSAGAILVARLPRRHSRQTDGAIRAASA